MRPNLSPPPGPPSFHEVVRARSREGLERKAPTEASKAKATGFSKEEPRALRDPAGLPFPYTTLCMLNPDTSSKLFYLIAPALGDILPFRSSLSCSGVATPHWSHSRFVVELDSHRN